MGTGIVRLDLDSFELLPQHTRRCVFWEVDPATNQGRPGDTAMFGDLGAFESEFDKEAWISGLLLEWGTCGQIAVDTATNSVVGTAFYAPPNRVPRSTSFPTSPVSHDAVLLTSIRTEPGHDEAATLLLDAVLADLMRRGVRAVEAFGLVRSAHQPGDGDMASEEGLSSWTDESIVEVAREILDGPQGDLCTACMIDAGFLKDSAFDVVASHPRFPRFRLELDEGLGWKFEVESALEKLVVMAAIDLAGRERSAVPVGLKGALAGDLFGRQ
ncbi:hypothetical protein [Gordonia sp. NPDC003422]